MKFIKTHEQTEGEGFYLVAVLILHCFAKMFSNFARLEKILVNTLVPHFYRIIVTWHVPLKKIFRKGPKVPSVQEKGESRSPFLAVHRALASAFFSLGYCKPCCLDCRHPAFVRPSSNPAPCDIVEASKAYVLQNLNNDEPLQAILRNFARHLQTSPNVFCRERFE